MPKKTEIDHYTDKEALDFHIKGKSGKIEIGSSKPLTTKRDLSLAYSPGVAAPVKEIAKNPDLAYDYTSKGNLVAVISNGVSYFRTWESWVTRLKTCNGRKICFVQTLCRYRLY